MNIISKIMLILFVSAVLFACHTVQGVGQDVSASGHALTRAAS